jgi:hypothetical protein
MKKLTLIASILALSFSASIAHSETWIEDFGYYHFNNEVSAKDGVKEDLTGIFDFENSPNPGGEKIEHGKYYFDVKYKGKRDKKGSVDVDHVYLEDVLGKDGTDGTDGDKVVVEKVKEGVKISSSSGSSATVLNGQKGDKGDKGDTGLLDQKTLNKIEKDINNNTVVNNNQQKAIASNSNRIDELEETQWIIEGQVQLKDTKRWNVRAFAAHSIERNKIDRAGVKILYKFGESYEEKVIKEQQDEIDNLRQEIAAIKALMISEKSLESSNQLMRKGIIEKRVSILDEVGAEIHNNGAGVFFIKKF